MIEIRMVNNIKEIKSLHKRIFEVAFPEKAFYQKQKKRDLDLYLFMEDKSTLGYTIVSNQRYEMNYHLWMGGILPSFQGKGYYGQFLDKIIDLAKRKRYRTVSIASYNHRPNMLRLVIKKGFCITGTEVGNYEDGIKIKFKYFIKEENEIRISLTNICNFKCFFCHNEGLVTESPVMISKSKLKMILDQAILNNCNSITFTGGEPAINREALAFAVDFCNELTQKPDLIIVSNGSMLDADLLKTIRAYRGRLRINLSLHSFKNCTFQKITQTDNKYKKTLKALDLLRQAKIDFRLNCVVLKKVNDSKDDFQNIIEKSVKKNVKKITFLELLVTEQNKKLQEYYVCYDDIKAKLRMIDIPKSTLILEFENNKKVRYILTIGRKKISLEVFKLTCKVGCQNCINVRSKTIGPDGEYYPCFILSNTKCGVVSENMAQAFEEGAEIIKRNANKYGHNSPMIV